MNELTAPFGEESKREPNSLISERFSLQFDLGFNFNFHGNGLCGRFHISEPYGKLLCR